MSFWELVLAVIVGNLLWTVITLPVTILLGVVLGVVKAWAAS